jgi:hypothetical protein
MYSILTSAAASCAFSPVMHWGLVFMRLRPLAVLAELHVPVVTPALNLNTHVLPSASLAATSTTSVTHQHASETMMSRNLPQVPQVVCVGHESTAGAAGCAGVVLPAPPAALVFAPVSAPAPLAGITPPVDPV